MEAIPRPVCQPMLARPGEKVGGGPFSKVSGLELPVAEGLRQDFVSSSPTQGEDYDQVYVNRHQKAATPPPLTPTSGHCETTASYGRQAHPMGVEHPGGT